MAKIKDIGLINFFVFNPTLGAVEGEEYKKLLYFYPSTDAIDAKIKVIGLTEAIINFMEMFTESPCESLHTQKTKQLYFKPEKDFWIAMTVSIPTSEKQVDGKIKVEYYEDHVIDKIYHAVLERSYKMFKMFNGSISYILSKGDIESLKERLEHFYNKYLCTLRINHSDILDIFNGIHYLPLDRSVYLKVQSFVNRAQASIPEIKHTVLLYNYQLIRSSIELEDLSIVHSFLMANLYPAMLEQDFQSTPSNDGLYPPSITTFGRFVLGPQNLEDSVVGQIPQVHLGKEMERYHLIVYRYCDVVLAILIDEIVTLKMDLFRKLSEYFEHHMKPLKNELAEQKLKRTPVPPSDLGIRYVYFNKANCAEKSSMHTLDGIVLNVHPDVMRVVSNLNVELNSPGTFSTEDCETVVKMASDCWVVGKKTEDREIYIVMNQKIANLIEINEEVKKLCSTHFCNIFFFD